MKTARAVITAAAFALFLTLAPLTAFAADGAYYPRLETAYTNEESLPAETDGESSRGVENPASAEAPALGSAPALAGITVTSASESVARNATLQLSAAAQPDGAAPGGVKWRVINRSGSATITQGGLLTGRAVGEVIVHAEAGDGSGIYGEKTLTITQDPSAHPEVEMTNLVVFVRFKGDSDDDFNAIGYKSKRTLWMEIKENYNCSLTSSTPGSDDFTYDYDVDDSFSQYIREISCGKIEVYNYFPQDYNDGGTSKISYLDLSQTQAAVGDDDGAVIREVINAFNDPGNPLTLPAGAVLDRRESGVLDNLTIVIQGPTSETGIMRSHKSVASNDELLGGKYVRNYNILCGDGLLFDKTGLVTHEFLHSVGLPDLYRYSGSGDPVGAWDIMANEGSFLQFPLSYQRSAFGWAALSEVSASGEYYLTSPLDGGGNQGLIIRSPMSESEFFVVEYREKNPNALLRGFEIKVPESGVIVYRVNTALETLTNAFGEDYIYIFRDDETGLRDAYSGDRLRTGAALAAGETRGTSDLTDAFSEQTIFYSDGSNSGIVVRADGEQPDGTMKVTVSYPDYASLDLWEKLGGDNIAQTASGNAVASDAGGNIYAAYAEQIEADWNVYGVMHVKKWDGAAWSELASPGNCGTGSPLEMECFDGNLYLSYCDQSGNVCVKKYNGTAWTSVLSTAGNFSAAKLSADASSLFALYLNSSNQFTLAKLNPAQTAFTTLASRSGDSFGAPALAVYGGSAAVASCDFDFANALTRIDIYDERTDEWVALGSHPADAHAEISASGDDLYALLRPVSGDTLVLKHYNGAAWSADIVGSGFAGSCTEFSVGINGGEPIVMASLNELCRVWTVEQGAFVQKGFEVRRAAYNANMLVSGGVAYVAASANGGALGVYQKALGAVPQSAQLASLSVEGVALNPAFSSDVLEYTASVGPTVDSVTISAAARVSSSSVAGAGDRALEYGPNGLEITVTADSGASAATYTIMLTRQCVAGDVNTDGVFNVKDAVALKRCLDGSLTLTPIQLTIADYNADGELNAADLAGLMSDLASA